MKFKIDKTTLAKFPNMFIAIPIIKGFKNELKDKDSEEFRSMVTQVEEDIRKEYPDLDSLLKSEKITAYREIFNTFGINPDKRMPTHFALAKRVVEGGSLPQVNPVVDLYNAMSIKYLTPFGGENLDHLFGDAVLKLADGGEDWYGIGASKSKPAKEGELIWIDDMDIITRALNWRQCERTKLSEEVINGYFIMDGFEGVNSDNILDAAKEFTLLMSKYFGGESETLVLNAESFGANVDHKVLNINSSKDVSRFAYILKQSTSKKSVKKGQVIEIDKKSTILDTIERYLGIEKELAEALSKSVKDLYEIDLTTDGIDISKPVHSDHGDYSTNIAMKLTKKLGKSPLEIGEAVAKRVSFGNNISKVEVVKPGFINMHVSDAYLLDVLTVSGKELCGNSDILSGRKVMIEFTDPNPFKLLHTGHIFTNIIGESFARLLETSGAEIKRVNYQGDVGLHVGKTFYGVGQLLEKESLSWEELSKYPLIEKVDFLGKAYILGNEYYEGGNEEEVRLYNRMGYVIAQEAFVEEKVIDYKQGVEFDQKEYDFFTKVYLEGREWCLEYFETIYEKLGTKFDYYTFESHVGDFGTRAVLQALTEGVFEKDDGAVVFRGEKFGLHDRVFINSDGLPIYEAKDFGLAQYKDEIWPSDLSIIITGSEQSSYFDVMLKALEQVMPNLAKNTIHVGHGLVLGEDGKKMGSRKGNFKGAEWFIEEVKDRLVEIINDGKAAEGIDIEQTAGRLAVAAVKYVFLRTGIGKDVVFNLEEVINFDGDSGPYVMYAYTRAMSIMSKVGDVTGTIGEFNEDEKRVLKLLGKFPGEVAYAAQNLAPNKVVSYLFELAQAFNNFYQSNPVLGGKEEVIGKRVAIVKATASVLKKGLHLIGVQTVEKM